MPQDRRKTKVREVFPSPLKIALRPRSHICFFFKSPGKKHYKRNRMGGLLKMPEPSQDSWMRIKKYLLTLIYLLPPESITCSADKALSDSLAPLFSILELWVWLSSSHSYIHNYCCQRPAPYKGGLWRSNSHPSSNSRCQH